MYLEPTRWLRVLRVDNFFSKDFTNSNNRDTFLGRDNCGNSTILCNIFQTLKTFSSIISIMIK